MHCIPGDLVQPGGTYRRWLRIDPDGIAPPPGHRGHQYVDPNEMILIITVDVATKHVFVMSQRGYGWIHPTLEMRKL